MMKRITIILLILIIAGVGIVAAKKVDEKAVAKDGTEEFNSVGNSSKNDLSGWD